MTTVNGQLKFRCEGMTGPPCVVKRGDVVQLKIKFVPGNLNFVVIFLIFFKVAKQLVIPVKAISVGCFIKNNWYGT